MASNKENIIDIRKTGPLGYKALQLANSNEYIPSEQEQEILKGLDFSYMPEYQTSLESTSPRSNTPEELGLGSDFGTSMFDQDTYTTEELLNYQDVRAENQPTTLKWLAGLGKGIGLAGTTFVDGTVGLVYGGLKAGQELALDAYDLYRGKEREGNRKGVSGWVSHLWDNEISNSMAEINKALEEAMPNYRTQAEQENEWYENLGTANFWADSILKNMGFMVGAYYSGGAWNNLLKGAGLLKDAIGAKVVGSTLSAVNEARVSANHNTADFKQRELAMLRDKYTPLLQEIESMPDTFNAIQDDSGRISYINSKSIAKEDLKRRYENEVADIEHRANKMGVIDLTLESAFLSLNNFYTLGKLYAGGYKRASQKALEGMSRKEAREQAFKESAEQILREEAGDASTLISRAKDTGKYVVDKITKKNALGKALLNSSLEGNEEMMQAFISSFAGNTQSYDNPDAYYLALTDPNAERNTKSVLASASEGLLDSYGNASRYEEFAAGFINSLFGIPTVGKVNNSGPSTWLGKGKTVGVSGGLFGEFANANFLNQQATEAVDYMNKYMSNIEGNYRHFVQSDHFTDIMNGFAADKDAFEFKNNEDNNDFVGIAMFAKMNRLQDIKDIVSSDFENMSNEELDKIAKFTRTQDEIATLGTQGHYDNEGNLTDYGREILRKDLLDKRDKILKQVDAYEESVATVRAISNESLNEDQVTELAWVHWKLGRFNERFKDIKENNADFFSTLSNSLLDSRDSIDEESEEGKKYLSIINNAIDYISYLQKSNSSLDLARRINANKKLTEFLTDEDFFDYFVSESGMPYTDYVNTMQVLSDAAKIASAYDTFNNRLTEYIKNPTSLVKNRQKINNKKETVNAANNRSSIQQQIQDSSVNELVQQAQNDEINLDELDGLFTDEDNEFLNSIGNEQQTPKDKVKEAKNMIGTHSQMNTILNEMAQSNPQAARDAQTLLNASIGVSNSEQEMLDTASQAFNDPNLLYNNLDPSMQAFSETAPEELQEIINDRLDDAKTLIEEAKSIFESNKTERDKLPSVEEGKVTRTLGEELVPTATETGHDSTEKGISENERAEKAAKEEGRKSTSIEEVRRNKALEISRDLLLDISKVLNLLEFIDSIRDSNKSDLIYQVTQNPIFKGLNASLPNVNASLKLVSYIEDYINSNNEKIKEEPSVENIEEDVPVDITSIVDLDLYSNKEFNRNLDTENEIQSSSSQHNYWKPTSSRLPIHPMKGDMTPFYATEQAKRYPEHVQKRLKAVWEYLNKNGAFDFVDSGQVKQGEDVYFGIDPTLNDQAGEIVILMSVKRGDVYQVIGELGSKQDSVTSKQTGLLEFIDYAEKEWEKSSKDNTLMLPVTSKISKNMVGKVPYTNNIHTDLNIIFTSTNSNGETIRQSFKLGVALGNGANTVIRMDAGRKKKDGPSEAEQRIIAPLNAKAGQTYLLLPTSNPKRDHICVPIAIPMYSNLLDDTKIGNIINRILERLNTASDREELLSIKRQIKEFLALKDFFIDIFDDGNIQIRTQRYDEVSPVLMYKGPRNADLVSTLKTRLSNRNIPIRVNRKYINGTYNGESYNDLIGEIAVANLPVGTTHTLSEWFTVDPIVNGERQSAKSPKSTRVNPNHVDKTYSMSTGDGRTVTYNIDKDELTINVTKDGRTNVVLEGQDKYRAYAWMALNNKDLTKPYNTKWGWFNPVTGEFISDPNENKIVREFNIEETNIPQPTTEETDVLDHKGEATARQKALLNTEVNKKVWEVLSNSDKKLLASKPALQARPLMNKLSQAYSENPDRFKYKIHSILGGTLYRKPKDKVYKVINIEEERKWLSKVLPQLNNDEKLKIVSGLIKIPDSDKVAYGQFKDGIITLASNGARGTLYHEAFHSVAHTLLSDKEFDMMLRAGKEKFNTVDNIETEELLAEDFRKYVQKEKGFKGKLVRFFRTIKHIIQSLRGKESYLDNLYYRINRGKLADRQQRNVQSDRYRNVDEYEFNTVEDFQRTLDSTVNNLALWSNSSSKARKDYLGRLVDKWKAEGYEVKTRKARNTGKYIVTSMSKRNISYGEIEQYHREKFLLHNLSNSDIQYLKDRGITIEELNKMSPDMIKTLLKCKS